MKTEYYTCEVCGRKFEVTDKDRMATFTLMRPNNWTCPKCGKICVADYSKKDDEE